MKEKFPIERIVKLLIKEHTAVLDQNEQAELRAWLDSDPANGEIRRRLSDEKYMLRQFALYKESDHQGGWEELKKKISAHSARKSLKKNILKYACVAAVVALSIIGVRLDWSEIGRSPQQYAIEDVVPGRNDAVIELASGEKIVLNEKQAHSNQLLSDIGLISGDSMLRYDLPTRSGGAKKPEMHTFRVPKGATTKTLVLSDSTCVWLNAGSSITYPVQFYGLQREVAITGECYFDVSNSSDLPFVVRTQDIEIRVMGTQFNVMSYADDRNVETTLVSGLVSIKASNKDVVLKPGVQAVYNKENSDISLKDIDTSIYTAWKDGMFQFNNMNMENICLLLGRWYDIEFEFEDYKARSMLFNGTIKRDKTLAFILDRIKETKTIDYRMEDGKVIITKR